MVYFITSQKGSLRPLLPLLIITRHDQAFMAYMGIHTSTTAKNHQPAFLRFCHISEYETSNVHSITAIATTPTARNTFISLLRMGKLVI